MEFCESSGHKSRVKILKSGQIYRQMFDAEVNLQFLFLFLLINHFNIE